MVFWIFWLSAITSLVIRSVGPVNWYFDMVWWLLWSINKQHSSVHSFLQFHTSFVKQVWISITTSEWCIWRADQPHWAHLSAPWLLLRRSRTLPSMTSRNVLQGVAAGFDFFFWQLTVIQRRGQAKLHVTWHGIERMAAAGIKKETVVLPAVWS